MSCFTLANSAWPSIRRLVPSVLLMMTVLLLPSDRGKQLIQHNQSHFQSLGIQPADDLVIAASTLHKACGYLLTHRTSTHITLLGDRGSGVNNLPKVIVWKVITSQSWLIIATCWFNWLQPSPSHNTQHMSRTLSQRPMVLSKATVRVHHCQSSTGFNHHHLTTPNTWVEPYHSDHHH